MAESLAVNILFWRRNVLTLTRVWLLVVGVVFLLVRVSRGERSLGVRIRGLVQAMQTQAHTQAALQAQLEAQQAQAQERANVWWSSMLRTRFEDGAVEIGWDEFVRLF
ncbi:hypothetical protein Taro_035923 [Colocasia esculenta]|uniref:Uncharacterized protein n=1 Tax=Colocasia esculenta TaxID=4460 RepID=A0A843WEP9_COLES|nr:hypothetical protein [Colocasia esculenta]